MDAICHEQSASTIARQAASARVRTFAVRIESGTAVIELLLDRPAKLVH